MGERPTLWRRYLWAGARPVVSLFDLLWVPVLYAVVNLFGWWSVAILPVVLLLFILMPRFIVWAAGADPRC